MSKIATAFTSRLPASCMCAASVLIALHPGLAHAGAAILPTDFVDESMASALDLPTGLAEVPDATSFRTRRVMFVEQLSGNVRLLVGTTLYTVGTVPGVATNGGERGLLGVTVDPGWPARPYVYIHCTDGRAGNHVAVSRFTLTGDLTYSGTGQLAFDPASRYDLRADFPDNATGHNGGTVRFGPDGMLYVSLGDDTSGCPAQDLTVAVGKILRLDVSRLPATGTGPAPYALLAPADNPFAANADSIAKLVYAEGLRNPFRFNVDAPTGSLVIGDVGLDLWEEIDLAPSGGMDFGWPIYEGPAPYLTCSGTTQPAPLTGPITDFPHPEGEAIIGGPMYRRPATDSLRFPREYDGDIFYSDYYTGIMRRVKLNGGVWSPAPAPGQPTSTEWATGLNAVSDMIEFSDGSLWYARQNQGAGLSGELRRIMYVGTANAPSPSATALVLNAPRPNPSRGGVTLSWTQPLAGRVTLAVYATDGRRVRTLIDDTSPAAGPHALTWDGLDGAGRRLRAGLYFARLEVGGEFRRTRLTLLR